MLLHSDLNKGIFFLATAIVCTFFASCDKKDNCQDCDTERVIVVRDTVTTEAVSTEGSANASQSATTSQSKTTNASSQSSASGKDKSAASDSDSDDSNVSIINPNDKSNSDSKRTYGSSGK